MAHCECGTLQGSSARTDCQECGTSCCRTFAVEVDSTTYCRWCAIRLMPAATA
ncbi:MAG: hypothetical protein AABZ70_15835 [candidate division NC10 bacterium]